MKLLDRIKQAFGIKPKVSIPPTPTGTSEGVTTLAKGIPSRMTPLAKGMSGRTGPSGMSVYDDEPLYNPVLDPFNPVNPISIYPAPPTQQVIMEAPMPAIDTTPAPTPDTSSGIWASDSGQYDTSGSSGGSWASDNSSSSSSYDSGSSSYDSGSSSYSSFDSGSSFSSDSGGGGGW